MDRSEVQRIVEREIGPLKRKLGIEFWKIGLHYNLRGEGDHCTRAQCTTLVAYNRARIEFDPDAFDDEEAVLDALRHELFHVVLAPFDLVANSLRDVLDDDLRTVFQSIRDHAVEKAVVNLERMYLGLTSPPDEPEGN